MTKVSTRKQGAKRQAAPAAEAKAKPEEEKTEERRLYVGPTIYGVARTGSVYIGIPSGAEEVREDVPDIVHLFIPITDFGKAQEQIRKGTGYIGLAYGHALAYADKKRNGGIR